MQLVLTEHFQKEFSKLSKKEKETALKVLLKFPKVIGDPHKHSGLGLRKIHQSGIFEARIGLGLRMVVGQEKAKLILHRIGNHDDIKKYLKKL
jgi:mRNA-degrading endonuclease YafQ of YafQ-DinJ toxin-antitoxin module